MQLSTWEKEAFYSPQDVIIVGSGVVGLWSAYYLTLLQPGLRVLVVDREAMPLGASTRNAGFACFGSPTELLHDARTLGEQKMLEIVAMRYEGLRRIRKTFNKNEIAFERFGGYELITEQQYPKLKQLKNDIGWLNITLRKAIKDEKVFRLADKKLKGFGFAKTAHLVESKAEAQLHPGKLVQALLRKVQEMGVRVVTQVDVKSFETINGSISVQSNLPVDLRTQQLLICTNGFATQLLPDLDVVPARGQVLITSPIKKLPFRGTFHFDEGFFYFRNVGNRVLLGGARNKALETEQTHKMETSDFIQKELERFLREVILPKQSFTIENRWSGIMGMGGKKLPILKKVKKNVYCAVRMSGMGIALAPVVGDIIAKEMIAKRT
jgi:gamma-glutamylputrescine oxidase